MKLKKFIFYMKPFSDIWIYEIYPFEIPNPLLEQKKRKIIRRRNIYKVLTDMMMSVILGIEFLWWVCLEEQENMYLYVYALRALILLAYIKV